jgi:hypothetical protein
LGNRIPIGREIDYGKRGEAKREAGLEDGREIKTLN